MAKLKRRGMPPQAGYSVVRLDGDRVAQRWGVGWLHRLTAPLWMERAVLADARWIALKSQDRAASGRTAA
jgi:hypothetical protein